mmetsp:Transcript_6221/g.6972  ORF Transcript_6221/g.6972 Transcript_6221/m.6972 type:complete len:223 (+) Transcript_6221:310-978(+)
MAQKIQLVEDKRKDIFIPYRHLPTITTRHPIRRIHHPHPGPREEHQLRNQHRIPLLIPLRIRLLFPLLIQRPIQLLFRRPIRLPTRQSTRLPILSQSTRCQTRTLLPNKRTPSFINKNPNNTTIMMALFIKNPNTSIIKRGSIKIIKRGCGNPNNRTTTLLPKRIKRGCGNRNPNNRTILTILLLNTTTLSMMKNPTNMKTSITNLPMIRIMKIRTIQIPIM